jgi:hypothetical protein
MTTLPFETRGETAMRVNRARLGQAIQFCLALLLIALFVLPSVVSAQEWNWTTSQVDVEGTDSWLTVDRDGNVHVSYHYPTHDNLKYGFLPAGGSHWFNMTLDEQLGTFLTRIAVDPKGNPYICYTPGIIKLATFDGHKWKTQQIDPGSGLVSYYCSVLIGQDGVPQLSWYVEAGFLFRYAALRDGVWVARTIDNQDAPGKMNAMALDAAGLPFVSYIGLVGPKLKYAHFDGREWINSIVDAPDQGIGHTNRDRGMGNSIVIDRSGSPIISYFNTESLKVARLVNGAWKFEVIDRFPLVEQWAWRFFRSTIVLDQNGNPHIGYQSSLGLKHAWWDGTRWNTQLIVAPAGTTFDGAMAIDSQDNLYFSYTDAADRSLKLAVGHHVKTSSAGGPVPNKIPGK